jgi:exopolysaccharide biosynthesis WecB/TagA/CpsF family protein
MNGIYNLINKLFVREDSIYSKFEEVYNFENKKVFTYFNQNSFNHFFNNSLYQKALQEFIVYQEGIGIFILLKSLGVKNFNRIDSTRVLENFINFLIKKNESIVFIGGNFEENELRRRCFEKNLQIELYINGFFDKNFINILAQKLKNIKSRYIVIGIGTPKQELLAYELKDCIGDKNFICVGNFMNFFLGYQPRAPKVVRTIQLEWFFRFLLEPRRLFKRYIIGIPLFFFRIILLRIKTNNIKSE